MLPKSGVRSINPGKKVVIYPATDLVLGQILQDF